MPKQPENAVNQWWGTCPRCKTQMSGHSATDGEFHEPNPDDFAVCFTCGALLVYLEDSQMRQAGAAETEEFKSDFPALSMDAERRFRQWTINRKKT